VSDLLVLAKGLLRLVADESRPATDAARVLRSLAARLRRVPDDLQRDEPVAEAVDADELRGKLVERPTLAGRLVAQQVAAVAEEAARMTEVHGGSEASPPRARSPR
jgi:hypothetical protein